MHWALRNTREEVPIRKSEMVLLLREEHVVDATFATTAVEVGGVLGEEAVSMWRMRRKRRWCAKAMNDKRRCGDRWEERWRSGEGDAVSGMVRGVMVVAVRRVEVAVLRRAAKVEASKEAGGRSHWPSTDELFSFWGSDGLFSLTGADPFLDYAGHYHAQSENGVGKGLIN
jgi:hypothetical protein